jgi:hypothetical protein
MYNTFMCGPHEVETHGDAAARDTHDGVMIVQDGFIEVHVVDGDFDGDADQVDEVACDHVHPNPKQAYRQRKSNAMSHKLKCC